MSKKDWSQEKYLDRWVDYLEGELEPSLQEDLSLILEEDEDVDALLKELKAIKEESGKYFAKQDKQEIDPDVFDRIHSNVMSEIRQVVPLVPRENRISRNYLAYAASICLLIIGASVGIYQWNSNTQVPTEQFAKMDLREMIQNAKVKDISSFSETVMNHEDDMDLLLSSGAEKLEGLSQDELNAMFDRL